MTLVFIALGGACGALLRYGTANLLVAALGREFPYSTLVINILGSFLIGICAVWFLQREWLSLPYARGVIVGVLGAYTTFSTFSLDTLILLEAGEWLKAGIYVLSSVLLCLLATGLGLMSARAF
ncbi:fluoride efflux transporter CrcB [Thiofilum flexile]|uniref:fluoride efflux transporter CrcB n=1 Tax=Thiofilum flexile TaxID=125627 RepID=UPI00039D6223|nr:fluoride efflux transporter CrcB [Thiofilum flexile]